MGGVSKTAQHPRKSAGTRGGQRRWLTLLAGVETIFRLLKQDPRNQYEDIDTNTSRADYFKVLDAWFDAIQKALASDDLKAWLRQPASSQIARAAKETHTELTNADG